MKSCYCTYWTYWTYWTYNTTVPTTAPKVEHSKPLAISPAAPGDATTGMTSLLVPWALGPGHEAFPSRSRPPQPRSCDLILHQYRHRNLK